MLAEVLEIQCFKYISNYREYPKYDICYIRENMNFRINIRGLVTCLMITCRFSLATSCITNCKIRSYAIRSIVRTCVSRQSAKNKYLTGGQDDLSPM